MKLMVIFAIMSLLPLLGCTIAEEYIDVMGSTTGVAPPSSKTVQEWFNKGNHFYNAGSYELAIKCFDKAIELDPSYEPPWVNKGFCLKFLGRYEEALNAFDKATTINPLSPIWNEKGKMLLDQGKYNEALVALNIAIELNPKDKYAWSDKGHALGLLGKYDESIIAFDEVIRLSSESGWINEGPGKFNESIRKFEFIKINPLCAEAWHLKGVSLEALGRINEAKAAYAKAKELGYTG